MKVFIFDGIPSCYPFLLEKKWISIIAKKVSLTKTEIVTQYGSHFAKNVIL